MMPDRELRPTKCGMCGKPLAVVIPAEDQPLHSEFLRLAKMAVHNHCLDSAVAMQKAERVLAEQALRVLDWEKTCPAEFRKPLNVEKRGYNSGRLQQVMDWVYSETGLLIIGPTALCKTRFMLHLLAREFSAGRTIGVYRHAELRQMFTDLAAGNGSLNRFVNSLLALDILFIDDLGKGRVTPASEEAFYAIVDARVQLCKPTMFTANTSIDQFKRQLSDEYREPLSRRITDKSKLLQWT